MGASYCDCHEICPGFCKLENASKEKAALLTSGLAFSTALPLPTISEKKEESGNDTSCIMDAYFLSALAQDKTINSALCQQAHELVKHSKETFWIDSALVDSAKLCDLELMAWTIFDKHQKNYQLDASAQFSGVEWWVQIKPISYPTNGEPCAPLDGKEAIDLHYDKDEALAESFGLGVFPTLATVTYLTQSQGASPTIILSRRYDQPDGEPISTMFLSHPHRGKHILFDGSLLHGAPAHYALREYTQDHKLPATDEEFRITFLVNVWIGHHPVGVQPLDDKIREALVSTKMTDGSAAKLSDIAFEKEPVPQRKLYTIEDLDPDSSTGSHRERIRLPFLGKGTTWESKTDADTRLVLSTFVPPGMDKETTTCQFLFGPGLEAFVESPSDDESEQSNQDESDYR